MSVITSLQATCIVVLVDSKLPLVLPTNQLMVGKCLSLTIGTRLISFFKHWITSAFGGFDSV